MTRTIVPDGDGFYTEVVGVAPFYTKIDEDPADTVEWINMDPAALATAKYSVTLTDYNLVYGNQRPNSVTVRASCRQSVGVGYKVRAFIRTAGFDYFHPTQEIPTSGFTDLTWSWDDNPYTAEEWEDADLDSLEIGVEVENAASETGGVDFDNIVVDFEEENAGPGTWSTITWSWSSQKTGTVSCYPVKPGTFTIRTDEVTPQELTDSSTKDGTLVGDGSGLIDYTSGRFAVSFSSTPPPGTKLYEDHVCTEGYCGHCKTNAVRFRFIPGALPWGIQNFSQLEQSAAFEKLIEKLNKIIPANVVWVPIESVDSAKAHFGYRMDAIEADTWFWRRQESFGIGDGILKNFTGNTFFQAVKPSSLIITAIATDLSTMTVTDDGSGNLIGDVDGGGTNTVDYETGAIDVTFDTAVNNGERIYLEYRYPATDNGFKARAVP